MQEFPQMVYKDIEKNGDVSEPGNQREVGSLVELKAAIADGWRTNPEEAKALAEHDAILGRNVVEKAAVRVESFLRGKPKKGA